MKWAQPGHEFDSVYENIAAKKAFFCFGAGDYGHQFIKIMQKEIAIKGFIDNDSVKQQNGVLGYRCFSLEAVRASSEPAGIIVTVSQFQRQGIVTQLEQAGYVRHRDFFLLEEFLSVYFVYKYDRVYFSSISFLPSTACNLHCKACLNFNPFAQKFYVREWNQVKADLDLFFRCVDYVMLFHVSGGEPALYPHWADVIEYLATQYGERIGTLRTVTNGTVVPKDAVLQQLSQCDFELTVDDYREAVPQYNDRFKQLLAKLDEYHIKYYINKVDSWIDLAPERTDFSACGEEWLQQHFSNCCQNWQELRAGKLFSCNYSAYAAVAGLIENTADEVFDLQTFTKERNKELVEFRLGFNAKGYTEFCRKCRGFGRDNPDEVVPAEQKDAKKL